MIDILDTSALRACTVVAMALAAGCSSSSSAGAADGGGARESGAEDGSVAVGEAGDAAVPSVCDAIPRADIQALLPTTVATVTTQIGGGSQGGVICVITTVDNVMLSVQTYPADANKSKFDYLLGGDPSSTPFTYPISGIGDEAYYFEATTNDGGTGVSSPNLAAHKTSGASPTCGIESNDPPDTTLKSTPDGLGGFTATASDVVAYVQLMGKVCNDVFAAE